MDESSPPDRFLRKGDRWLIYAVAIICAIAAYLFL